MQKIKWWMIAIVAALVIIPALWMLVVQLEGGKPVIAEKMPDRLGGSKTFAFTIGDEKSGLRSARVWIVKNEKEYTLFEKDYPAAGLFGGDQTHSETIEVPLDIDKLGISDGDAIFRISVRDYSWREWFHGNETLAENTLAIDTKAPGVEILSRAHNVNQGGAGLVVYKLSEPCVKSGLIAGDKFFPGHSGYFNDENMFLAFFALAYNQSTDTKLHIEAEDFAGNTTKAGFYYHLRKKNFKTDVLRLSDYFLDSKMPEFKIEAAPQTGNPNLDKYLAVNREMRRENETLLATLGLKTEPAMHWEGEFLRLPNSAPRAAFADHREYFYNDNLIDKQIHMGVDLASLEKSPVPAANAGKVVFTDYVGIYGNTVAIDHGFGLVSLYSHLSGIDVKPGEVVAKGQTLGRTGISGLAGGDHLHFGMMIHDTMINPIEWWDGNWIMHNVTDKLKDAKQFDKQ